MYEKEAAIALVEEAQQNKIRWNYATWQMKVNLIYDMRNGLNDWVDDFTDEERGDAVLTVLGSARNEKEFGKVMYTLKKSEKDLGIEPVNVAELLIDKQHDTLMEIKTKFNYFG